MSASRHLLLTSLTGFYNTHPEHRNVVSSIIRGESRLSLRVLDWFVTHYARMNNIVYYIDTRHAKLLLTYPDSGGGAHIRKFNLHLEYRKQLQSYTKMFFDPFRRHERISFVVGLSPLTVIETTVGQLNFFRWSTENQVIAYIYEHLSAIESHMAAHQKTQKSGGATPINAGVRDIPNTMSHGLCHVLFS